MRNKEKEKRTQVRTYVARCRKERSSKNINVWLMTCTGGRIPWKSPSASVFASRRRNLCKSSYVTAHYTSLKVALMRTRGVGRSYVSARNRRRYSPWCSKDRPLSCESYKRAGERRRTSCAKYRIPVTPSTKCGCTTLILRWHWMQFSCIKRINLRIIWPHVMSKETVQCHCQEHRHAKRN